MRAQSVVVGGARARVARGDRGLQRVRAARAAERLGALERREPAPDQQLVPARAVLIEQQDRLAVAADARARARDAWISISATRPCTSGSSGASSASTRPRRSASSHSAGPHPVVARGRRVALVEDEVDDLEHRREPRGAARRRAAPRTARCASASVRLARTMRCAIVGSGTRNARAISSVVRPPSSRSVSATRASVESTGWHAVKTSRSRSSPTSSSSAASTSRRRRRARRRRARAPSSSCLRSTHACRGAARRSRGASRSPSARRPGCPARPSRGHCSSAATSASCASSSASPTSRTMRASPAMSRARLDPPDRVDRARGRRGHARRASALRGAALATPRGRRTLRDVGREVGHLERPAGSRSRRRRPIGARLAHSIASSLRLDLRSASSRR